MENGGLLRTVFNQEQRPLTIFDFDGVFYCYPPGFYEHSMDMHAETASSLHPELDVPAARQIAVQSWAAHKNAHTLFIEQYAMDRLALHLQYHDKLDVSMIEPLPGFREALQQLSEVSDIAILTHSGRSYVAKALARLGVDDLIQPSQVFPLEDVDFSLKNLETACFNHVRAAYGNPQTVFMVEDTSPNLAMAKQAGLHTILVHWEELTGRESALSAAHPHVDGHYADTRFAVEDLIRRILAMRQKPAPGLLGPVSAAPALAFKS